MQWFLLLTKQKKKNEIKAGKMMQVKIYCTAK